MKINIPSLDLISKGQIDKIEENYMNWFSDSDEKNFNYLSNWLMVKNILVNTSQSKSKNVKYITEPFFKLVDKHWETLTNIHIDEVDKNDKEFLNFNGILFSKRIGCILEMEGCELGYTLFDNICGVPLVSGNLEFNKDAVQVTKVFLLSVVEKSLTDSLIYSTLNRFVFSILLEKMIDGKDIIIVPPNGRIKTKHEKYVNDNLTGIEVWDSRMFNTYVRLEGFPVTGHFRHQIIGEGRMNHKLIWINEFEKHGYNRNHLQNNSN